MNVLYLLYYPVGLAKMFSLVRHLDRLPRFRNHLLVRLTDNDFVCFIWLLSLILIEAWIDDDWFDRHNKMTKVFIIIFYIFLSLSMVPVLWLVVRKSFITVCDLRLGWPGWKKIIFLLPRFSFLIFTIVLRLNCEEPDEPIQFFYYLGWEGSLIICSLLLFLALLLF